MITLPQATKGKKVFHIISLWENPENVTIENIKFVHNENRFYIEYKTQEGIVNTDVNTSFALKKPKMYK